MIPRTLAAEFRTWNAEIARARLHHDLWPISSLQGIHPWCAGDCGKHVAPSRVGQMCRRCTAAVETRNRA